MIGRTNIGAGVGLAYAYIQVTYPEGSTCTCTDGTKVLNAKDTTGLWLFGIPYAGTWTASITDGTNVQTKSITISSQYQVETVELAYGLYLLKDGVECTDLTGTWEKLAWQSGAYTATAKAPTITYEDGYVRFYLYNGGGCYSTLNAISFSGYSALNIEYYRADGVDTNNPSLFTYEGTKSGYWSEKRSSNATMNKTPASGEETVVTTLDISSLTASKVGVYSSYGNSGTRDLYIYNVWLTE